MDVDYDYIEWCGVKCPLFDRLYPRVEIPVFDSPEEQEAWEDEQLKRCLFGYGPFCGRHYFYYNFCWIKKVGGAGKIRPELRMTDNLAFRLYDKVKEDCTGFVMPKRRRQGATWRGAANDLYDLLFFKHLIIGYASEDERKSAEYVRRVKFIFDNMPTFLKTNLLLSNRLQLHFAKQERDDQGNKIITGNDTMLEARAPGNEIWEAYGIHHVSQDESGKLPKEVDLIQWADNTMPILVGEDGLTRAGYMCAFGTVGEMDGGPGERFKELYNRAAEYDLMQFFIPGYFGIVVDEYGNDDFEAGKEKILRERKKKTTKQSEISHMQQYPLDIGECFVENEDKFFFNVTLLESAEKKVITLNPTIEKGYFVEDSNGIVRFEGSDKYGHVELIEEAIYGIQNMYAGGIDPIDHDGDNKVTNALTVFKKSGTRSYKASDLAFVIYKRKAELHGEGQLPVCIYSAREKDVRTAYKQAMLAARYYQCLMNVEQNRYGLFTWAKETGNDKYLASGSSKIAEMTHGTQYKYGYNRDQQTIDLICQLLEEFVDNRWNKLFFPKLIEQLKRYGKENTDLVEGFGAALLLSKHYDIIEAKGSKNTIPNKPSGHILPVLKRVNGKLVRQR